MNASGHFATTSKKRNRHQLFHSALAHVHQTTKRLTTPHFAGSGDTKTVSGKEPIDFSLNVSEPLAASRAQPAAPRAAQEAMFQKVLAEGGSSDGDVGVSFLCAIPNP
jgi:hypothetical protein